MSLADATNAKTAVVEPWLSIVGIGEGGIEGLTSPARALIESAAVVFGGARHLDLARTLIRGAARPWRVPFDSSMSEVLANRGRAVCVLASGDPMQHGVGSLLARHVSPREVLAVPSSSAYSLAAARLLWPLSDLVPISLCGRPLESIRPHLHPGARILALSADARTPQLVAQWLTERGFGRSRLTALEALGATRERIRETFADEFALGDIDNLNTLAIEVAARDDARILPRSAGLADDWYEHDGQITKHEVRSLTLSALAPRRGEALWDIGSGSGSVAIEWLLADASLGAIAIEHHAERAARIRRNAQAFGVSHLQIIQASAPAALEGLAAPDAIFIGGGAGNPGMIETAQAALRSRGRLVINAVTLETEAVLLSHHKRQGGSLVRVSISRAGPVGAAERSTGWRAAMPVTQWSWSKP